MCVMHPGTKQEPEIGNPPLSPLSARVSDVEEQPQDPVWALERRRERPTAVLVRQGTGGTYSSVGSFDSRDFKACSRDRSRAMWSRGAAIHAGTVPIYSSTAVSPSPASGKPTRSAGTN